MAITLQQIRKSYMEGGASQIILSDVSAEFTSGCFSVVKGKSGSGKSTLLNLIGGIDTPDSGSVLVENRNISMLSDHDRTVYRRRHIGFIFQFFNLIPTLTVLENTLLVAELDGKVNMKQRKTAEDILMQVGLVNRMDTMPDKLSGGEQQRVAIARALAHDPDVILADEPTGNLDHETGNNILALMLRLIHERGKTLIMATHSDDALSVADHVFCIENGLLHPLPIEE